MQMWCNAWTFRIIYTKSISKISQKLHQFWKTPKIFKKTQNLDLNAWRMRDREIIPSDLRQEKAENHMGWRFWERRGCLGGKETDSIERCRDLKCVKKLSKSCPGSVERCPQQKDLNGSRSYQESIEHSESFSMDQVAIENAIKSSWKGSIDSLTVERCLAVVEIA